MTKRRKTNLLCQQVVDRTEFKARASSHNFWSDTHEKRKFVFQQVLLAIVRQKVLR